MSSTYSTNLALELIGTGDQAGTWGNTTNTNLGTLIEQAISGYVTQAVSTGTDTTITIPNGATGVARNMYIELTGTGGTNTNLIVPANKKLYFIFNNASGAVTVKVSGQTGVSVPAGKKVVLASNGTDTVNALNYIADFGSNSATITQLTATSATITNLTLTSLVISNLSIASANITTLTSSSATITNLLGTTLTISGNSFLATSSGNVGIGTSSPASKLHVSNTAAATRITITDDVAAGRSGYIESNYSDALVIGTTSGVRGIRFSPDNTPRMLLDTLGNLGIGTSSPAYKLDVVGAINASAASPTGFNHALRTTGVTTGRSQIYLNNTSGDLVLGIEGSTAGASYAGTAAYSAFAATTGANPFYVITNSAIRATFDSSGNLGLGVTPSASSVKTFEITAAGNTLTGLGGGDIALMSNAYYNSGFKYGGSNLATSYRQQDGVHKWNIAPSGTADTAISFTQAMTLDASGNLGVGATSPSVSGIDIVKSGGTSTYVRTSDGTYSMLSGVAPALGGGLVGTTTNHPVLFYANNTERARITSGGNFGVGTTSPAMALNALSRAVHVYQNATDGAGFRAQSDSTNVELLAGNGLAFLYVTTNHPIAFGTNNSERGRFTAGGYFKASYNGSYIGSSSNFHELVGGAAGDWAVRVLNTTGSSPYGVVIEYNSASPNDTSKEFLYCLDSGPTLRMSVRSNGGIANYSANNVALSDERVKTDIKPVGSYWNKIKAIEIVTFKYKDQTHDDDNVGVIAQQVESVAPEFVDNDGWNTKSPEEDVPLKSIYTTDMYHAAIKALQEAMARIEKLEAEMALLKGA